MSDETTIARLRADLAASQAGAKRLAKEVGDVTERREFYAVLAKTASAEYNELRASIGQPVDERGASTHASAVKHGEWLTSGAKDRARVQRAEAFVTRLERDGIVIPSTAPADLVRRAGTFERDDAIRLTLERTARTSSMRIDPRMPCHWQECTDKIADSSSNPSDPNYTPWRGFVHWAFMAGRESMIRTAADDLRDIPIDENPAAPVRVLDGGDDSERDDPDGDDGISIDRTAAGCATACTDDDPPGLASAVKLSWYETPAEMIARSVAADDVLDDPRMAGGRWIQPTMAEIDAWGERPWEWHHDETTAIVIGRAIWGVICHPDTVAFRPLRFSGMGLDGVVSSACMLKHRERCEWQWREPAWFTAWRDDAEVKTNVMRAMGDKVFDRIEWRPVGWPDVDLSADELEANIDRSRILPPGAGAKAAAEYDAALAKYSPDMKRGRREWPRMHIEDQGELIYRQQRAIETLTQHVDTLDASVDGVKRRVASVSALLPLMEKFWERLNKIEGVEPEETQNSLLDGLVPVRADATHPGQWMTMFANRDATAWKRQAPTPNPPDGLIALIDKCHTVWRVKPDAIVYVDPE